MGHCYPEKTFSKMIFSTSPSNERLMGSYKMHEKAGKPYRATV